ncbi:hypothetical protein ACWKWU_12090 [Chitinophaga lutea]
MRTAILLLLSLPVLAQDPGWPRQISRDGNTLVYYQPQVDEWNNYTELKGRMAFSLTAKNDRQVLGVASLTGETIVDKTNRTVYFRNLQVTDVRFPSLSADSARLLEPMVKSLMPADGEPISVDRLMADIQQHNKPPQSPALKNDPPPIFYSATPAILLMVEGKPVLVDIEHTHLQYVVNTNWDLFYDKQSKQYFLLTGSTWMNATELKGPWTATRSLPKDMGRLPADQHFDDVKKAVPPPVKATGSPTIFFSDVPAELIYVKGPPVYTRIPGTRLLYISNTDNDVFLDDDRRTWYVLLSGRWFSAPASSGPWTYVGDKLPADFAKIPEGSPKAGVLASVPGTVEASDAVLLAQIPTVAIVNKQEAAAKVNIHYDGKPEFKPIETTTLEYAINTPDKVIKYNDEYYACYNAVWFVSSSPTGPWTAATSVPAEIYKIPSSSPVYNVTYVTQTEVDNTSVESSAAAGYFGMFVLGAVVGAAVVYGTGWYYPPYFWWGPGMAWPIYRPWPATYGAGFVYNPWTGGFAGGRTVYGPYGAAGGAAWYNPATGRYGRSASVQGWYGGRTAANVYNPWTGNYGHTSQAHNAYAQWGHSAASNGHQWVQTGHISTGRGTTVGYRTSGGQSGVIHSGMHGKVIKTDNGVFAGHDGNVYKKNTNGGWSQYNNRSWQPVNTPDRQLGQQHRQMPEHTWQGLHGADQARSRGQLQTQRFQHFQRSGGRFGGGGGFRRR